MLSKIKVMDQLIFHHFCLHIVLVRKLIPLVFLEVAEISTTSENTNDINP